jgi:hypothetical protein
MSVAEYSPSARNGASFLNHLPWPTAKRLSALKRAPRMTLRTPKKAIQIFTDRVRAKPAIAPTLSMNIGVTAIGLGLWGTLFPRHVARTLGINAPAPVVQGLFGIRELWTGFTLAGDPTRSEMLWTRVAGDVVDIGILSALNRASNPKRHNVRAALAFVLLVTALDTVTAIKMTNVRRNGAAR